VLFETFSVTEEVLGVTHVHDLKPNGRAVDVTDANKAEYVRLVVEYVAVKRCGAQMNAVARGAAEFLPEGALRGVLPGELQRILVGRDDIDVDELKATARYAGYDPSDAVVGWFWDALQENDHDWRSAVLRFATGLNKVPLDGFDPPLCITAGDGGPEALPRAHTCFCQLVLPRYATRESLVQKLSFAITETDAFHLA